ncbi:PrsW family intramembrane metalloprotease [Winogradskyella sp. DF17]|uniref:Protease PrsW n=1 Tax=Winogradskyella pelagia TaxID=2819984 RepID=A0ABS3T153_9FLAO|nr:PrsW family glutamic-type intramembrane protease [Winogradskyella sp. DF17]MBO3116473.1 PrsW family intramembrane metalloprotease [Winogradskyella sp. DF17]
MNIILSAVAPILVIIIFIYLQDKYDKEPLGLLLLSFVFGAIVSVIIVTLIYLVTDELIPITDKYSIWQQFIKAFVIVGFSEEFSKYIVVRYFAQPRKAFNEPYDGIIYAVMVSMGFACTENVLYVIGGGYDVALIRAFTAVPAHATFGILMGYFMGKAKFSNNRFWLNITGLLLAVLFHGTYDFFLFIGFIPGISIGAIISLMIGVFLSRKAIINHQRDSKFKSM